MSFGTLGQPTASQFMFGQPSATTSFGQPAPTSTSSGFSFGNFGGTQQQPTQTSGFGTTGPSGATGFGQQPSMFGQPQATGFGQPAVTFGQPVSSAASTGFGQPAGTTTFGQPAPTTTTSSGFSFGGFGAAQQPAQTSGFGATGSTFGTTGFGQQPSMFGTPQSTGFGQPAGTTTFGQPPATSAASNFSFGGFGSTPATQQPAQISGFGTTGSTLGGTSFGQAQTPSMFGAPQSSGFGTSFGNTTQPATSFGLQNTFKPATTFQFQPSFGQQSMFNQPQTQQAQQLQLQQMQQQQQIDEAQAFQQSVFRCHKFGDERDSTLSGLNYLQACWGAGKGYYSQSAPPTNYNQQNPFYRFKAVGYAFMYTDSNEDGQVVVYFKKPQDKINADESNIVSAMQQMLNRPNILIRFSGTKPISEDSTVAIIFAEDRNTLRRVPATDMAAALCQPQLKAQLENLGVTNVSPKVKPSPEQLKRYLDNSPEGIDPRVWTQAQEDNPDTNSMTPIPLIGVEALKSRIEWQEKETLQHHARLKLIGEDVTTLTNRHANMTAELQQMKRKHIILTHRLISIICRQELMRKQGTTLQADEDVLKKKLEEMDGELNSPTQYKGRLNELLSQIRLHKSGLEGRPITKYSVEPSTLIPVKDFLAIQQESVKHLVATTKSDYENLRDMMEGIRKISNKVSD